MKQMVQPNEFLGYEDGFSLLEILVVLLIVSITMAVAFTAFLSHQRAPSLESTAKEIARFAHGTRMQAINGRKETSLEFDLQKRTVTDTGGRQTVTLHPSMNLEVVTGRSLVHSENTASILFFADGTSTGGSISLSKPGVSIVKVRIPWLTGIPTISREPGSGS